jgi:hypothetical protein
MESLRGQVNQDVVYGLNHGTAGSLDEVILDSDSYDCIDLVSVILVMVSFVSIYFKKIIENGFP